MKKFLDKNEGVDKRLPCFVGISGLDNFAVNIAVLVSPLAHHHLSGSKHGFADLVGLMQATRCPAITKVDVLPVAPTT